MVGPSRGSAHLHLHLRCLVAPAPACGASWGRCSATAAASARQRAVMWQHPMPAAKSSIKSRKQPSSVSVSAAPDLASPLRRKPSQSVSQSVSASASQPATVADAHPAGKELAASRSDLPWAEGQRAPARAGTHLRRGCGMVVQRRAAARVDGGGHARAHDVRERRAGVVGGAERLAAPMHHRAARTAWRTHRT